MAHAANVLAALRAHACSLCGQPVGKAAGCAWCPACVVAFAAAALDSKET